MIDHVTMPVILRSFIIGTKIEVICENEDHRTTCFKEIRDAIEDWGIVPTIHPFTCISNKWGGKISFRVPDAGLRGKHSGSICFEEFQDVKPKEVFNEQDS